MACQENGQVEEKLNKNSKDISKKVQPTAKIQPMTRQNGHGGTKYFWLGGHYVKTNNFQYDTWRLCTTYLCAKCQPQQIIITP